MRSEKDSTCESGSFHYFRGNSLRFFIFTAIFMILSVQSASAEDIHIIGVYSDIDSADITLHSGEHYTDMTLDAELIFNGKVLASKRFAIEEIFPDNDITKVMSWGLKNPAEGPYVIKITLAMKGTVLGAKYYNFSFGKGWQSLPRIFIKDIISDSSGVSVILAPLIPQFGTEQRPVLADVEYMLVEGDTVIYRTTDRRVTVLQSTSLSKNWNVFLENNHHYSARLKVRVSPPEDAVIAQSKNFTAMDDARITELYRDETGASATIMGLSQVPFEGSIVFTVFKNGDAIEEIKEKSPILMSKDDETIEVAWSSRLSPGVYKLSVKALGNDGDVVDRWDTVIEAKEKKIFDIEPATPEQTPGFSALFSIIAVMLIFMWVDRRKR